MKRCLLLVALLSTGCSTVHMKQVARDGTVCEASRTAFFMTSAAIQGEACGGTVGASRSEASRLVGDAVEAAVAATLKMTGVP